MPTPLTDADKVLRNDTGKDIVDKLDAIKDALDSASSVPDHITLTQAMYDALVAAGTVDPTAFYFITDTNPDAEYVAYDNSDSGLTATDVQNAIDEVSNTVDEINDAITLDTSGTASARIADVTVLRSKIVNFNGVKLFNATIRAEADVAGNTAILDVGTGFEPANQQSLLVTASTGGTIQAYIQDSSITITRASSLTATTVYYIIGWYL